MPKMCAIPQLVSAPLNPTPTVGHFRRSHPQCEHSYGQHIYMSEEIKAKWNSQSIFSNFRSKREFDKNVFLFFFNKTDIISKNTAPLNHEVTNFGFQKLVRYNLDRGSL